MEETIKQAVESVKQSFSGYSFADQAQMFDTVAGLLLEQMDECLELEYGLIDNNK